MLGVIPSASTLSIADLKILLVVFQLAKHRMFYIISYILFLQNIFNLDPLDGLATLRRKHTCRREHAWVVIF